MSPHQNLPAVFRLVSLMCGDVFSQHNLPAVLRLESQCKEVCFHTKTFPLSGLESSANGVLCVST